ncbi:uncharacterized protein LOC110988224 isoform X2 [Acanthaster planci]|uniref:Uncharacterized protein LOC110988224 isoform X2 n=1 Tax=Acanthaster planci TaxID=133434 RepID=A0A8B7ZP93_ACAPL|nr:uncharacterized protein LOC110988224 isoform X2 [Acanthaster planci]
MTISTECASLTSTTSAPDSGIPGQGGNHTTAPLGQTQDSTATSGQGENSLTPSVVSTLSTNDHAQPGSTYDTTPSPRFITSSPGTTISMPALSLSVTVIVAVGGAVGVIILILFIIIACLVASRRKTERRGHREESELIYESPIAATDHPLNHAGDRYVNVPLETIVHSGPAATPHHHHVPPSGAGGLPSEYAQATPRSHRKPSFEYTVPNQDNLPSQEDVPPPEYAEVTPRIHRQQPQHDYSVANPDNPPSQAGMLPPEYAEVTPRSQRRQPPPEYAMLDPDNPPLKMEDDGYSYAAVQEEKCRASPDGEEKAEQEWSGEEIQSGGASYPFGEYAEVGQDFKSDSPELECLDMGKITGEISKGEEVVPYFVDNILYMDSSDEALIREQAFVNESLVTSKKKKKGKEKPRLDPF